MIRIALDAGHGLYTSGKRCHIAVDPNQTREWILNSRVAMYLQELLEQYDSVQTLRVDDVTGKRDVPLSERALKANKWKAHIILSIHHNAGANLTIAGGIVVILDNDKFSAASLRYQGLVYKALIAETGLRGNRSDWLTHQPLGILDRTEMPGNLAELGFMDSLIDTPIILTEKHARECAQGYLNFLVSEFNLKKKFVPVVVKPVVDTSKYAYVTASVLNIRNGRSASHEVIGQLTKGDRVQLLYLAQGWWSIDVPLSVSDKGYGFISDDWISRDKVPTPIVVAPRVQYAIVTAKPYLNVRDDANGKKIGILEDGSEVWIMGSKPGWYKVAWGPNQGWVSAQYIELK